MTLADEVPHFESTISTTVILVVFAAGAAAAAAYALVLAIRRRDPVPVVVCIGAVVCAFNEPIYNVLGKLVYADNNAMAFTAFDRSIPWFLVVGYLPWVGLLPYLVAQAMHNGVARKKLQYLALASFLSVVVVEIIGNSLHVWSYYGVAPLKYLVVAPQMAPVPIVGGFLLYAVADRLSGWKRALAAFVISTLALPMVFASCSWPLYVSLNSDLPTVVNWLIATVMLALSAAIVAATTQLAEDYRPQSQDKKDADRSRIALADPAPTNA